jgi:hypothetical protein
MRARGRNRRDWVGWDSTDERVAIHVRDRGAGIPELGVRGGSRVRYPRKLREKR